jgi:hypothetical protein
MKRRILCLLISLAAFVLAGQDIPQSAALSGNITDEAGHPLKGVTISVVERDEVGHRSPLYTATSDANGHFEITGILPGVFAAIFILDGFHIMSQSQIVISAGQITAVNMKMNYITPGCVVTPIDCTFIDTKSSSSITHICNDMLEWFR